jgi:hypothetical protein
MEKSEQKVVGPVRPRRKRQEMMSLLRAFEKTNGITVKEFCRQHHIGEGTFYNFRKRYQQSRSKSASPSGFIAIAPSTTREQYTDRLFAEVKGIKLYQPVTAEYLKSLAQ